MAQTNEKMLDRWRNSFLLFCKEALRFKPTNQQLVAINILNKLVQVRRKKNIKKKKLTEEEEKHMKVVGLSIMSGRGTGKDAMAAIFILWFFCMFQPAKVAVTAPSAKQLKSVIWSEINKWVDMKDMKGNYIFPFRDSLEIFSENIYKKGGLRKSTFVTAKTAKVNGTEDEQKETLSGIHEKYMAFILDESSGIPYGVYKPLKASLTDEVNLMLNIFNPNRTTGFAYDIHYGKEKDSWITLRWDYSKSDRMNQEVINEALKSGVDSNYYRVNVLGLPPINSDGALIPYDFISNALELNVCDSELELFDTVMGIDPNGGGGDAFIVCIRKGYKIIAFEKIISSRAIPASEEVLRLVYLHNVKKVFIDRNGVGYGVFTVLQDELGNMVTGLFSQQSARNSRFHRLRDELWWSLRDVLEACKLSIPEIPELLAELSAPEIDESTEKIKISSKKKMKSKIGKSTDYCDSLCLTYYHDDEILANIRREDDGYMIDDDDRNDLHGWMAC